MLLDQITFTRFIAALTVVFFHYGQTVFPANIPFLFENITAGPIAVGYFYVLSGFIMAIAYYQVDGANRSELNKVKYWVARFARIYPVYLFALLIIVAAKYKTLGEDWDVFLSHIFLVQSWIPGYPITLNTPGWSLSVEAFFYLCFPFLIFWVYKKGIKQLAVFSIVLWIATQLILTYQLNSEAYVPKNHLHDFIYYNPAMHLSSFLLGMLCGIYLKHTQNKLTNNNGLLLFLSFSLIFLLIWARPHLENILNLKLAYTNGLLAPAFLLFIITLARHQGIVSKVFSNSKLVLLGEASYSLYILQKPIHGIYDKIIVPRISLNETLHFYIFLVLLIIISIFSYKYFETPMRQFIRKKLQ